MSPSEDSDQQTESTAEYTGVGLTPETHEDLVRVSSSLIEEERSDRANQVPVLLMPARSEFEQSLLTYELLDRSTLSGFIQSFPADQCPSDALGFARSLVEAKHLTRYQASAVLQGKAKVLTIGRYIVLDRLGAGGMGIVYQARHRETGDVSALKLLPPSASKQEQAVLRFRREAKIMAQLAHPNIVAAQDLGEHNGVHYLVMDHVEGLDLHRIVRAEGPLEFRRALSCVVQAARGMAEAHRCGIIHRDIKPANLMVELNGAVRILDLGLARITHSTDPIPGRTPDPSLTQSGVIMGTVDFVAPEQSTNSKLADERSDIYSLGCTLHYLLTGRPPFAGESIMERLLAHHQQPVPSLIAARPDVPVGVDALFHRMMEKDPSRRPQTMLEVVKALEASISEGDTPAEHWESLANRWVAADRSPQPDDLSGYEVIADPPEEFLESLSMSEAGADPVPVSPSVRKVVPSPPSVLRPSGYRRWIGLVLIAIIGLCVLSMIVAFVRLAFGTHPS